MNAKTILIISGIAVAGFLVYKFVIKPKMDATPSNPNQAPPRTAEAGK
jgi:hypothetical protein